MNATHLNQKSDSFDDRSSITSADDISQERSDDERTNDESKSRRPSISSISSTTSAAIRGVLGTIGGMFSKRISMGQSGRRIEKTADGRTIYHVQLETTPQDAQPFFDPVKGCWVFPGESKDLNDSAPPVLSQPLSSYPPSSQVSIPPRDITPGIQPPQPSFSQQAPPQVSFSANRKKLSSRYVDTFNK